MLIWSFGGCGLPILVIYKADIMHLKIIVGCRSAENFGIYFQLSAWKFGLGIE